MTTAGSRLRRLLGHQPSWSRVLDAWRVRATRFLDVSPRRVSVCAGACAGLAAGLIAGPVAAAVAVIYGGAGATAVTRWRSTVARRRYRVDTRHAITLLAADLRAGANVATTVPATLAQLPATDDPVCRRSRDRLAAAVRIADTVGAPISTLLDQLAVDLRAEAHVAATLSTHTAGTLASGRLLAALPVVGLGLGQAMGADPLATLLYTPTGVCCVAVAVALQLAGMSWSRRILASAVEGGTS